MEKGYRKIVHLSGTINSTPSVQRLEGYRKALEYNNIEFNPDLYLEGTYDIEFGYEGIKKIIDKKIDFDSVFCGNDLIAIGAMKAAKELGYKVPSEIGVMSAYLNLQDSIETALFKSSVKLLCSNGRRVV